MPDGALCTQDKGKWKAIYENSSLCFNKSSSAFKNEYLFREAVIYAQAYHLKGNNHLKGALSQVKLEFESYDEKQYLTHNFQQILC